TTPIQLMVISGTTKQMRIVTPRKPRSTP
ncbi:hypothetical protein LCGC14_2060920, partial [marine sediment metagenome]